jgi:hypothetical protein
LRNLVFLVILTFAACAFALEFKGHQKEIKLPAEELNAKIQQVEETKTEFLILFEGYAAFYSFPIRELDQIQVRNFLQTQKTSQREVFVEISPLLGQILLIKGPL